VPSDGPSPRPIVRPTSSARLFCLAAALSLLAGCSADWGYRTRMAPGTPGSARYSDPARAVLARLLPQRMKDDGFVRLVDRALRSSRGQRIAEEAGGRIGELDAIRNEMRTRGLPSVFIGIPLWESYLDTEAVSQACAAGAWQLMPETAIEHGLAVAECSIGDMVWTPQTGTVASPASPYRRADGTCGITACRVDERLDLARSTVAALDLLTRSYEAPDVTGNADRAALTILAYNTGLGTVRNAVDQVFDPFRELEECADGLCPYLGPVAAHYVPGVVAAAGLATCAAAQDPRSPFAAEAGSAMCRALAGEGLLPTADGAVAAE
jgi:Transglycosylase SLT domain